MKLEIKIKNYKVTIKLESISETPSPETNLEDNGFDKEELKDSLDRVNMWLGNVDQKASILLAIEGAIIAVACTTDSMSAILETIKVGFNCFCLCTVNTWLAIMYVLSLLCSFASIYFLAFAISATIDPNKFKKRNPNLITNSMLHFVTIGLRSYEKFRTELADDNQKINDLRSQVYMNSIICTSKFNSYKRALIAFKMVIFFIFVALVLKLF